MTGVIFTRLDGQPREINPELVADISPAIPSIHGDVAKTLIIEGSGTQVLVTEDFAEVRRRLNW